ncbi:MAG: GNAT family N-acetyltransferase [Bacteroidota bacterium]
MQNQHIQLRAPEPYDIEKLYVWENDTSLWHHGNTIAPLSRYDLEQFILNSQYDIYHNRQLRLMIVLKETNEVIGTIDLFEFDPIHRRAGVGILIDKQFRKNGYATQSLQLLIEYAFTKLHLHQLYCNIISTHAVSLRLFTNNGFEKTATIKQWLLLNNAWEDVCFLQLIQK